jgi:hypothetical protein
VVASDANFIADDPDGVAFAFLSSAMFIAWFRLAGGRLTSRLRFNKLLVYNTFPAPDLDHASTARLQAAGSGVLGARAKFPASSLADLYDPAGMPLALAQAHNHLDGVVDKLFAPKRRKQFEGTSERQKYLFARYIAQARGDDMALFDLATMAGE